MPNRERMSPVDTAWLRMDSPGNLMMIVGVDVFEGRCDLERMRRVLRAHLLHYPQFRSRVIQDAGGAWWEEDSEFDLDQHLVRIGLAGKGDKLELQKLVAQLAGQALDAQRPLWQFHIVENYESGHALIVRIHHCIADGIALVGLLMGMTTSAPDDDAPPPRAREPGRTGLFDQWLRPFTDATVKAIDATGNIAARVLRAYGAVLGDPGRATDAATATARIAAQVTKDLAALALMNDDTATSLKGKPGGSKVVAWNEPLPLRDVKTVGKSLGCSVNDVLLSCVAGAIRGYLLERGEVLDGAELRAMVPVNLRRNGKTIALGNKFGLVPLLLPIGVAHPVERVLTVKSRMAELKGSYTAVLALAILGMAGLAPRAVQKQVLDLLAKKATAVMTNVPGPQKSLYMAGGRMKQMMFWVPQSGAIGMGVSILSYDGGVQFGLVTDKKLCAEPQRIIDRFAAEFEELVDALLLSPWDPSADPHVADRALQATDALAAAAQHLGKRDDAQARRDAKPVAKRRRGNGAADASRSDAVGSSPQAAARKRKKHKSAFGAARAAAQTEGSG